MEWEFISLVPNGAFEHITRDEGVKIILKSGDSSWETISMFSLDMTKDPTYIPWVFAPLINSILHIYDADQKINPLPNPLNVKILIIPVYPHYNLEPHLNFILQWKGEKDKSFVMGAVMRPLPVDKDAVLPLLKWCMDEIFDQFKLKKERYYADGKRKEGQLA